MPNEMETTRLLLCAIVSLTQRHTYADTLIEGL